MLRAIHAKKIVAAVVATTGIVIFALAPHAGAATTPSKHVLHNAHLVHCGNVPTAPGCPGVDKAAAAQAAQAVNGAEKFVGYKFNITQESTAVDAQIQVNAAGTPAQQKAVALAAVTKIKSEATTQVN